VADTPGHEQYTRNMVTGASTADLAVILIDARKGVLTQTRRHSYLVKLLGIRNVVLAINKIDLVDFSEARFNEIVAQYAAFAAEAGIDSFTPIPVSGLTGANVTEPSPDTPWYQGPPLLRFLEEVPDAAGRAAPFRMDVQWVNRPNSHFRGYAGRIASGSIRPGDEIVILPSGATSRVERIVTFDGDLDIAQQGQSVTLTLTDEVDCSRGNVIAAAAAPRDLADRLSANLVWMAQEALVPGRSYTLKIGSQTASTVVEKVEHIVDVNTLERKAGAPLQLNDIGLASLRLDRVVPVTAYEDNRRLGGFILVDRVTRATVAAGMVQSFSAGAEARDEDESTILWVPSASHAEQAALAVKAQQLLAARGKSVFVLNEAVLREGLNTDLDPEDKAEAVRRAREVARLMSRAGVTVIVAIDIEEGEAHPGRLLDIGELDEGAGEWVI
jgi:bifunctional enzyme CysN/CysC